MKLYLLVLIAVIAAAGCSTSTDTAYETNPGENPTTEKPEGETGNEAKSNASPKDAVQAFVNALEAKDEAALKASLSEKTNKMFELQTKLTGRTVVDIFDSKEFEDMSKMPETKNEKIDGDKATLEVKDPEDDKWTPIEFVKENGSWKMAFADADYDKEYVELSKQLEKKMKEKPADKDGDKDKDKESDADSGSGDTSK